MDENVIILHFALYMDEKKILFSLGMVISMISGNKCLLLLVDRYLVYQHASDSPSCYLTYLSDHKNPVTMVTMISLSPIICTTTLVTSPTQRNRWGPSIPTKSTRGVSHTLWPCHLHFKSILRQNKNYGKFKYFTMQKKNLPKKKSLKNVFF
jgi:hypothetical protein